MIKVWVIMIGINLHGHQACAGLQEDGMWVVNNWPVIEQAAKLFDPSEGPKDAVSDPEAWANILLAEKRRNALWFSTDPKETCM